MSPNDEDLRADNERTDCDSSADLPRQPALMGIRAGSEHS